MDIVEDGCCACEMRGWVADVLKVSVSLTDTAMSTRKKLVVNLYSPPLPEAKG